MSRPKLWIAAALCGSLLFAFRFPAARVAFRPADGSTVQKTFETTWDLSLEDLYVVVMGEEIDPSLMGDPQVEFSYWTEVAVSDEYVSVADGRPVRLRRAFDSIAGQQVFSVSADELDEEAMEFEMTSELEGAEVLFSWDEDDEEYGVAYAGEDDRDEDLLAGVWEDMDLRGFLPDGEVSEGDSWEIGSGALAAAFLPGGDLALLPDMDALDVDDEFMTLMEEFEERFQDRFQELYESIFEGETTGTYEGTRDEDGVEVHVLAIEVQVDSTTDFAEIVMEIIQAVAEEEGVGDEVDIDVETADVSFELEGEGELLWDAQAHRVHAFKLETEVVALVALAIAGEIDGELGEFELEVELGGEVGAAVTVE